MSTWLTWRFWYEVLSSLGFGIASSLVPVLNSEIFIVGSLASGLLGPLEISIGLAIGHAIGKLIIFVGIRKGKDSRWFRHKEPKPVEPGSWRDKLRRWNVKAAHAVEHPKWGVAILMFSTITGVPPGVSHVDLRGNDEDAHHALHGHHGHRLLPAVLCLGAGHGVGHRPVHLRQVLGPAGHRRSLSSRPRLLSPSSR